jgi:p-cumate 2,3-dioxygenase subunit alpha
LCQRGYNNAAMAGWNDISKGMHEKSPIIEDEAQMRVFWREWDRRMAGARS